MHQGGLRLWIGDDRRSRGAVFCCRCPGKHMTNPSILVNSLATDHTRTPAQPTCTSLRVSQGCGCAGRLCAECSDISAGKMPARLQRGFQSYAGSAQDTPSPPKSIGEGAIPEAAQRAGGQMWRRWAVSVTWACRRMRPRQLVSEGGGDA